MVNAKYASFQNNMDTRARNANLRENITAGVDEITQATDLVRRYNKLKSVNAALGNQADAYGNMAEGAGSTGNADGVPDLSNLDPSIRYAAMQKAQELQLMKSGIDVSNIDQFGDMYGKFNAGAPDISKMISTQKIAKIRADALQSIANARNKTLIQLQRIKNNANGGDPGASSQVDNADATLQGDEYLNNDNGDQ